MSTRLGCDKDTQKLVTLARKGGWIVSITGGNHIKFVPPGKGKIIFGALTGCRSGQMKLKKSLLKAGVCC